MSGLPRLFSLILVVISL